MEGEEVECAEWHFECGCGCVGLEWYGVHLMGGLGMFEVDMECFMEVHCLVQMT